MLMLYFTFEFSNLVQDVCRLMSEDPEILKSGKSTDANTDSKVDRKRHSSEIAPASDSRLTAVQKEARELYRPKSGFDAGARSQSYESAGDLQSVNSAYEAARLADALSRASIGLKHINNSMLEIQRSPEARYMLGSEFGIVAIVAIAGIARRRADLSSSQIKSIASGKSDQKGEVIYQSPKFKEQLQAWSSELGKNFKRKGGAERVLKEINKEKDVPEWMISLDTSVAKEAGYLFNSVLRRPTVLMTSSDTFVSLGEQHFFDAVLAWLIVDLNKSKVTEFWKGETKVVAVANGELIELPVWEDIIEFHMNKPKQAKADNLLTVVLKRSIDRELIEAALADVVVPGDVKIVQGKRSRDTSEESKSNLRLEDILPTMFGDD